MASSIKLATLLDYSESIARECRQALAGGYFSESYVRDKLDSAKWTLDNQE